MQDCGCRNSCVLLSLLTIESGGCEHARAHKPGISHLDTHLGCSEVGVENGSNVADCSGEASVGISVQANGRFVSKADDWKIIFVDVTNDPDVGQVRDREWIWGTEA